MSVTYAPGTEAYVTLPHGDYTFDSWVLDTVSDAADVSDYERVSARWLPGLVSGTITLSGPYSVNSEYTPQGLGMVVGTEYEITLGLNDTIGVPVTVLVRGIKVGQAVRGIGRVDVTGVVNSDLLDTTEITEL